MAVEMLVLGAPALAAWTVAAPGMHEAANKIAVALLIDRRTPTSRAYGLARDSGQRAQRAVQRDVARERGAVDVDCARIGLVHVRDFDHRRDCVDVDVTELREREQRGAARVRVLGRIEPSYGHAARACEDLRE